MRRIQYESLKQWKYRLTADLLLDSSITGIYCKTEYIRLKDDGELLLFKGYAWDGPSGPTIDTEDSMRGSAGHDALYQLIGLGAVPESMRLYADLDLRRWCIEDGMPEVRADIWYRAVRVFGGNHVD